MIQSAKQRSTSLFCPYCLKSVHNASPGARCPDDEIELLKWDKALAKFKELCPDAVDIPDGDGSSDETAETLTHSQAPLDNSRARTGVRESGNPGISRDRGAPMLSVVLYVLSIGFLVSGLFLPWLVHDTNAGNATSSHAMLSTLDVASAEARELWLIPCTAMLLLSTLIRRRTALSIARAWLGLGLSAIGSLMAVALTLSRLDTAWEADGWSLGAGFWCVVFGLSSTVIGAILGRRASFFLSSTENSRNNT